MTMRYYEFLSHIRRARLTVSTFAQVVGMNRISVSNYAKKGEVPCHLAIIALLFSEMRSRNIDFAHLLQEMQIVRKKPRGAGIGKFGGDKQQRLF